MYSEPTKDGAYPYVLQPWFGSKPFSGTGVKTSRGLYAHSDGTLYKVVDNELYSISEFNIETLIGTIAGSGDVVMADDGVNLLIATDSSGHVYDGTTLSVVTDGDYEAGGSVAAINNQAIWQGFDQRFGVANVGDPLTINGLNYGTAESSGDDLLRVYVFKEVLYLFGRITIEAWYNSGVGNPPFARIQSGKMDVGVIGKNAVSNNENFIYWLSNTKKLYRTSAYDPVDVMPPWIATEFEQLPLDGATVRCLSTEGQNLVLVLTALKSWCYSESNNEWYELSYGAGEDIYIGHDYAYTYRRHFIQSRIDGKILEIDKNTYQDNGETIVREIITAPLNSRKLGIGTSRFRMRRAEIMLEPGVGTPSNPNPQISVSISTDNGQTFSNENWIKIGGAGQNDLRAEFYQMINATQVQFKIRASENSYYSINGLALDVTEGGKF